MSAPGVTIRRATADDLPRLRALRAAFFRTQIEAGLLDLPEDLDAALDRTTPALAGGRRQFCLVAGAADAADAYLSAVLRLVPGMRAAAVGSIEEVYVAPGLQRHGAAARLVREAVALLRQQGASRIQTRVLAANDSALAFWKRAGFTANVHILELAEP